MKTITFAYKADNTKYGTLSLPLVPVEILIETIAYRVYGSTIFAKNINVYIEIYRPEESYKNNIIDPYWIIRETFKSHLINVKTLAEPQYINTMQNNAILYICKKN